MKKSRGKKSFPEETGITNLQFPSLPSLPSTALTATQQAIADYEQLIIQQMTNLSSSLVPKWVVPSGGTFTIKPDTPKPPSVDIAKLESLKAAEPYKVTARMPDYVHVITAWRAWAVNATVKGLRLEALGQDDIWEPKKAIDAVCRKRDSPFASLMLGSSPVKASHASPQMACTCGVWAFKELDSLVAAIGNTYGEVRVLGQVSLWGRVVETENGYRAEKAYPSELWLLDSSLEELGLIYDVPVRTID